MVRVTTTVLTALTICLALLAYKVFYIYPQVPQMRSIWWGPGKEGTDDPEVRPFKVSVPPDTIIDLKMRLNSSRILTPPLEGIQQQYGINSNLVKKIVQYWLTEYDWSDREAFLNQYPHFKTQVQGLKIHFIHVKPKVASNIEVVPLLMLNGWASSIREFYEVIPILTTPQKDRDFVFELIIPSLPGFGFSDAATKPGCGTAQMAVIFNNLMKRLGYYSYYIHGSDWGAAITSYMALLYPTNVLGLHSNLCIAQTNMAWFKLLVGSIFPPLIVSQQHRAKIYPLFDQIPSFLLESGYLHIQSTKPDTIGVALNESPSGLAAYILEKFITLTNREWKNKEDGGLSLKYSYTDLLDNVMIYWITGSITTSMRIYAESLSLAQLSLGLDKIPIKVPSACAKFPHEIVYQPDSILKERFHNLVQSTEFLTGGHFAALEEPKLLAHDIWLAVEKMRRHGQK